jgi:hypothetical protein
MLVLTILGFWHLRRVSATEELLIRTQSAKSSASARVRKQPAATTADAPDPPYRQRGHR